MANKFEELVAFPNRSCIGFTDIMTKSGKAVAQVVHGDNNPTDEDILNTNILISSGDALNALIKMIGAFGSSENRNPERNQAGSEAIAAAEAAIAKATSTT